MVLDPMAPQPLVVGADLSAVAELIIAGADQPPRVRPLPDLLINQFAHFALDAIGGQQ
jgi:hypothetical protein